MSFLNNSCSDAGEQNIREPAVAGKFYTGNPEKLEREIADYLDKAEKFDQESRLVISPHAGYVFSGPVAAYSFKNIKRDVERVIIIGPSHHKYISGVSIPSVAAYRTPLGLVRLDKEAVEKLEKSDIVTSEPQAHMLEHSIEVQIPFLQYQLDEFRIVPILCGKVDPGEAASLIKTIIDEKTLVVISSDFSHFHSYDDAKKIDSVSVNNIMSGNENGKIDACGSVPIKTGMELAGKMGLKPKLLDIRNSYDTAPSYAGKDQVVGYASIVYLPEDGGQEGMKSIKGAQDEKNSAMEFTAQEKQYLLDLARSSLERAVKGKDLPEAENLPEKLKEPMGCFVTLNKNGRLRGCIGYLESGEELYKAVMKNARNAALSDFRFPSVKPEELDEISIEISVLTKPAEFEYNGPQDLLSRIEKGKDGIILQKGAKQSTFLPQVWEQLPDKTSFLEHLAMKAGLPKDGWKDASYKKYHAVYFHEK